MIKLSWWEEFIIGAAVSFLTMLISKITNPIEQAGLQSALMFLQRLMNGQVTVSSEPPIQT